MSGTERAYGATRVSVPQTTAAVITVAQLDRRLPGMILRLGQYRTSRSQCVLLQVLWESGRAVLTCGHGGTDGSRVE
eukprot:1272320-Rhodomonas_salina.2